jgi:hypothetical protein
LLNALVGAVLVGHGLITTSIGFSGVTNPNAAPMAAVGAGRLVPAT